MADLKVRWDDDARRYDLVHDDDDQPALDDGVVHTAVIAAVLSWGRAREGDPLPGFDGDRKGHWADPYDPRGRKGSLCWLLTGRIITPRTLADAQSYLDQALATLVPDWIASYQVRVWRRGITTIAAVADLILPDGREMSVDFDSLI
ncbi:phage GP46 family protein [Magnetospirillum fulvum]|uniref:Bacteriophage protein GP46 n=1 Tax=Magnetospirillum fulvum MGU-K5 TaxID=1316936 RepID=S9SBA2_MAGFU|nr:phage GP46 family protein [Magnetospirillum fulvum]EPY01373.1 bacteriophage protein GP46 [Magnetospirillum fulvum MGU-K5]